MKNAPVGIRTLPANGSKSAISPTGVAESDAVIAQRGASGPDSSPTELSALADLLTALPDSDRTDIIAGLPRDQILAVAKLIVAKITEDNHE